jgi:signal recognition particle subunit SRP14
MSILLTIIHKQFFASLTTLLSTTSQKAKGSVFLTQKRLSFEDPTIAEGSILVRATDGGTQNPKTQPSDKVKKTKSASKVKLSTIVAPADLESFFVRYADVCKAGMVGMKKRDRSAKKKGKAKTKAAAKP